MSYKKNNKDLCQDLINNYYNKQELLDAKCLSQHCIDDGASHDVSNYIFDDIASSDKVCKKDDIDDVPTFHALLATNELVSLEFE
jgi:hypothetical protein